MIIDLKEQPNQTEIEADICIIGAGAAGITIAHSLISSGLQVCLLESGGFDFDAATNDLHEFSINKNIKYNIEGTKFDRDRSCRLRYFGGTTNHWAGWCAPLDEIDFQQRSWVEGSGWPISLADMQDYYSSAYNYVEINNSQYTEENLSDENHNFPEFESNKLETTFWKVSPPTRFGTFYRDDLADAKNISVYLNANLVEIATNNESSSVNQLKIKSLNDISATVTSKSYVLACGALENARLLLSSDKKNPAGLGNESGWLGRNYQNHPHVLSAIIRASDPQAITELYQYYENSGDKVLAGVSGSEILQKENQILNFAATIQQFSGYSAARQIWNSVKNFRWPAEMTSNLSLVISDLLKGDNKADQVHQLYMYTEQAPNYDSQIRLGEETDALGQRRAIVDWNLTELDKHTVQVATNAVAEEFGRLNLGRLKIEDWCIDPDPTVWPTALWGGCHQIGSTKMSDSPDDGVVDKNCRMHSIDNLYVAGSSVFPTGGHVPPTLTIVALALRLSDHLKRNLA